MSLLRTPRVIIGTLVVLAAMIGSRLLLPIVMPHITLAPETIATFGPLPFTNTMLALLIAEVILIVLAFLATRSMKLVPSGLQNFFEVLVEFWENQSIQLIGPKLTRRWLPLVLTVFTVIWFSNYLHFLPGFDSIGILCEPGACPGEAAEVEAHAGEALMTGEGAEHVTFDVRWTGGAEGSGVGLIQGKVEEHEEPTATEPASADAGGAAAAGEPASAAAENGYAFVPYFRVAASDLNFTLALALIAFVSIEVVGFRTWGAKYLTKFLHIDFSHGVGTGLLNVFVGLIELISELARVISFAFRLFGNIFAGSVLLLVFVFLIPFLLAVPIYGLELFVGIIQAFVFAILILAFITLAAAPPHGNDH